MSSIIAGYNNDIFISYRQKDNKYDGWITEFVENLKKELDATCKEDVSVYFDINPHNGLLETHDVDASLKEKLKCLIFIPIISRTFCDPKSYAWEHEFKSFVEQASQDKSGLRVILPTGNVATRVLPIQIHEIAQDDKIMIERLLGGVLRPVEFIYKEPGVNRPLRSNEDHPDNNQNKTIYRNQINKVANAIDEILAGLKNFQSLSQEEKSRNADVYKTGQEKERKHVFERSLKTKKNRILIGSAILALAMIAMVLVLLIRPESKESTDSMTMPVTIINENGQKETRRVFKEKYVTKISLFPFSSETDDSSILWLQNGFPVAIWQDLRQFNYISMEGDSRDAAQLRNTVLHLQEQINYSRINNSSYFLTGSYRVNDSSYSVTSKLFQTSNGIAISERKFKGNDFFSLIDSISLQTRLDLRVPKSILNRYTDLPFKEQSTENLSAFRNYIIGTFNRSAVANINESTEIDSTFALGLYENALNNYSYQESSISARQHIDQAMRHRQRLSENDEISVRILYYLINGEADKAVRLSEMQYELQPTIYILERLVEIYDRNFIIPKLENAAKKLNEILPGKPYYQLLLGRSYMFSGKYDKGLDLMRQLLKNSPENVDALIFMAELHLLKSEFEEAKRCYQKAILLQPENEKKMSWIVEHISYSEKHSSNKELLNPITGNYRFEDSEMSLIAFIHNTNFICKAENQLNQIIYPISDSKFSLSDGINKLTFIKNDQGKVVNAIYQKNEKVWPMLWKEDSLILKAMTLLNDKDKAKALDAFRNACFQNPEHYYLPNFIKHLEFIQSSNYEKIKHVLENCKGKYNDLTIYEKNDIFFYRNAMGYIYKLLPVSESQFISPSFYDRCFKIIKENNHITGLDIIHRDGRKEFLARKN